MKKSTFIISLTSIALLTACSGTPTEQDYKKAFIEYVGNEVDNKAEVTIALTQEITVADSIEYITFNLAQEYQKTLAEKKLAWESKQAECELDEKATILRHEDYMKKYEKAKRQYGNDIKHKNKIDGYLKAAQKLPSTHEEYLQFDRRRDYSFTRDAENLKAEYNQFAEMGLNGYVTQHPYITQYNERNKEEVIAHVYHINYTDASGEKCCASYLFNCTPLEIKAELKEDEINIVNFKNVPGQESESPEIADETETKESK